MYKVNKFCHNIPNKLQTRDVHRKLAEHKENVLLTSTTHLRLETFV